MTECAPNLKAAAKKTRAQLFVRISIRQEWTIRNTFRVILTDCDLESVRSSDTCRVKIPFFGRCGC